MKAALPLFAAAVVISTAALAATTVPVGHFDGIHATDGASVTIRHGATQQVTIVKGDPQISVVEVRGNALEISTCRHTCPREYGLEVVVTTPNLDAISVEDGAVIDAQGNFPAQDRLAVKADDGGRADTRAIPVAHLEADATDGGEVDVRATAAIIAKADEGGAVRYWGKPASNVSRASDGGSVSSGD